MTYYTITETIKGMTKSDQVFSEIKSESKRVDGHIMARLHLLEYFFRFDRCEAGTKEDCRIDLRNKKLTVVKSYRLRFGINLTINLN